MADHRYKVLRHMVGDQAYEPGDERVLNPADAAHLVASGAVKDLGPVKEKAEADAPKNKAEGDSPSNKAAAKKDDAK
jgi:hypothetical protein